MARHAPRTRRSCGRSTPSWCLARPAALLLRGAAVPERRPGRPHADVRARRLRPAEPQRVDQAGGPAGARRAPAARALRERRTRPVRRDHRGGPAPVRGGQADAPRRRPRLFLDRFSRDELRTLGALWKKLWGSSLRPRTSAPRRRAASGGGPRGSRAQPLHALVELGRVEQRERQPQGRLRAPLGVIAPPGMNATPWLPSV